MARKKVPDAKQAASQFERQTPPAAHRILKTRVRPYLKAAASLPPGEIGAPWSVAELCAAYHWPTGLDGGGVIAVVELGGGWLRTDVDQYFSDAGLAAPQITDVSVDGVQNSHCDTSSEADAEVALDIQVAAAAYSAATGKAATVRVYWTRDIASAIRMATADGCDVCSIAWGADESVWGAAAGQALEQAVLEATEAGMIVFAAAGDNDSSDGGLTAANVDLPSSAPHVIACGGTRKTKTTETVWNDQPGKTNGHGSGGGFSKLFGPMPLWQAGAPHGPGRMVPDVAANSDPRTGYEIVLRSKAEVVGGTSAAASLYAGLFAAFGTKLGFITPDLYLNTTCFTDITSGDNGAFRARVGPDPCTGIGSPIGDRLAGLFANPAATARRELRAAKDEIRQLRATVAALRSTGPVAPAAGPPVSALAPRVVQEGDFYGYGPCVDGYKDIYVYDAHLNPVRDGRQPC
jgi:hypothetical protein